MSLSTPTNLYDTAEVVAVIEKAPRSLCARDLSGGACDANGHADQPLCGVCDLKCNNPPRGTSCDGCGCPAIVAICPGCGIRLCASCLRRRVLCQCGRVPPVVATMASDCGAGMMLYTVGSSADGDVNITVPAAVELHGAAPSACGAGLEVPGGASTSEVSDPVQGGLKSLSCSYNKLGDGAGRRRREQRTHIVRK